MERNTDNNDSSEVTQLRRNPQSKMLKKGPKQLKQNKKTKKSDQKHARNTKGFTNTSYTQGVANRIENEDIASPNNADVIQIKPPTTYMSTTAKNIKDEVELKKRTIGSRYN